ncbi:hypothetical protein ACOMHN_059174 [Nucella lapillus]
MDEFDRIRVIGKGSYGEVWLSKHKKDQKQYVLKQINLQRATRKERLAAEQEANLLQKLKHPNIVSYKQSFETPNGMLHIAMQFCEGGDLYNKLKEQKTVLLGERQVVEWFVQITMALQYLHERNILHRDLKTQNIFLTRSKIIKLGDLGIARVLDAATDMATTLIGTPYYMSPEIFSNKPYNHKSDVWALGCCLYEMTTLKHAFNAKDMNSLVYKILKGKLPPMPHEYSPALLDLLRAMLHQDPAKRPTINRILRDAYIRNNIAIFLEDTKRGANRRLSAAGKTPSSQNSAAIGVSSGASSKPSHTAESDRPASSSRSSRNEEPPKSKNPDGDSARVGRNLPVRKPSNQTPGNLLSAEKGSKSGEEKKGDNSEDDDEDTLKAGDAEEQREPVSGSKADGGRQERNRRPVSSRQPAESQANMVKDKGRADVSSARSRDKDVVKSNDHPTPTPSVPVPKADRSEGLPQKHSSLAEQKRTPKEGKGRADSAVSKSASLSDSVTGDDTARSLPNLSARDRRRQKHANSSMENPPSARNIKLREVSDKSEPPKLRGGHPRRQRQPSLKDSSSSSDEATPTRDENTKERQKRRDNKEMSQFISVLDQTLKRNMDEENSDDDGSLEVPASPARSSRESHKPLERKTSAQELSKPQRVETLTSTSRLLDRIGLLHKDCVQGVGYVDLKKAYDILDRIEEDEVEPQLMALLGKEKFDEYAGKIWQLKFCEEAFLMS